jgi:diguanylate cyclase
MEEKPIRVLLVDDDEVDSRYVAQLLLQIKSINFDIDHVYDYEIALNHLLDNKYDIYLVDYFLGNSDGLDLIKQANLMGAHPPIIVVTGTESEYIDTQVINSGAADYLPKSELSSALLERSIRHALDRHQYIQQLQILATRDPLTKLANRAMFYDQLEQLIASGKRHKQLFAVLLLDLDGFKMVNDTLGHQVGDELLKEVAERLTKIIRKEDVLARLGGDEFSVILNQINDQKDIEIICNKLLTGLCEPSQLSNTNLSISSSIGCAVYPTNGETSHELMKNTDLALYKAKNLGKNNFQFFSTELQSQEALKSRIKDNIEHAIKNQSFYLAYQPYHNLNNQNIIGFEALLRWNDDQLGDVSTDQIIPLIESSGLMIKVGDWILNQAIIQLGEWQKIRADSRLAVNISIKQLRKPNFVNELKELLMSEKINHGTLEFEINEKVFNDCSDIAMQLFQQLDDLGITLSINNYGAEYSSINRIVNFPISKIKLGRSMVANALKQSQQTNICQIMINLAHGLDLTVIAVGIESQAQIDYLKSLECDFGQGYFLNKPMQADVASQLLSNNKPEEACNG